MNQLTLAERKVDREIGGYIRLVYDHTRSLLRLISPAHRKRTHQDLLERYRLGKPIAISYTAQPQPPPRHVSIALSKARELCTSHPASELYMARIEEFELDVRLLAELGKPSVVTVSRARYGSVDEVLQDALKILDEHPPIDPVQEKTVSAEKLGELMRRAAKGLGLELEVRFDPNLGSMAAAGDRVVFLRPVHFHESEARRLIAHEVLGHAVSAGNGRSQPLKLLEYGTAESFEDQEGVALHWEQSTGTLSGSRLRTLAGRVLASGHVHESATLFESVSALVNDHGFSAEHALRISERAFRGGGVARDHGYLKGYRRVKNAIEAQRVSMTELQWGRVGVRAIPMLRLFQRKGWIRKGPYTRSRSRAETLAGTSPSMSPPNAAASLTRLELT